ncbi:hypothetical protein [Sphingomonas sp. Leaf10]|uniref:hypothetical protein n=1 Tax=Sphingomonas sp. Leaf10 TaxID=1735676 RepID=UPI0006FB2C5C|nr:hypothetical protein [Sphingomonas sp. Leaf10]KQM30558.1 hypothetical protein ASE59_08290 [Sphingomonas sp. Leaf10]
MVDTVPKFRSNEKLIVSATEVQITANSGSDIYDGAGASKAFVFNNVEVGDDQLQNFGYNDSILNYQKIFDGNDDGFIQFGSNGVLDIDRTSKKKAGQDQIQVTGEGYLVNELRYLGTKGGEGVDGMHVYANSATLKNLWSVEKFGGRANIMENKVGNETYDFSGGDKTLLVDNALGLNMGQDVLTGFGAGDKLVTTAKLFDNTTNNVVGFGKNFVLDVSGAEGPRSDDPSKGPGGQLDFSAPDLTRIKFVGEETHNGVTYYVYEAPDAATPAL